MELELLKDIVTVFGLSAAVLFVCHRARVPTIIGFLLTGVLAGPQGLGLIEAGEQVEILAEIGVVLLLFTVGIEISLKDVLKLKKYVLVGGSLQVFLTVLAVFAIMASFKEPMGEAVLLGLLVSLSSTAIVLRIIQKREEFDSLHGRTTMGILIFQDIAVVPMMLLIPMLPGSVQAMGDPPIIILAKGLGLTAFMIVSAKWLVPQALYHIARTGDREIFLLSLVAICFAVAWISSLAGLSLGLGAFLAGLIISESPYSHQAFGNVVPLRDAFTSFFFISIGMLLDMGLLLRDPALLILLALAVIVIKALVAGFAISLLGLPLRIIVLVALALSQIGEFSFVLSKAGFDSGLIPRVHYQIFLDVTVLTMVATSLLISISPQVAEGMLRLPLPDRLLGRPSPPVAREPISLKDHLIIIGYGVNGRNVARSAKREGIPYVIVEMDPEIVALEEKNGEPIYFGDAASEYLLQKVGIKDARVLVIAISNPSATRRIVELSRRMSSDLFIIARTRYIQEMEPLHELGANEVIPEEYETSIEIFTRILDLYQIPKDKIESFVAQVRADGYEMFRSLSREPYCNANISLMTEEISTLKVSEGSPAAGRPLSELGLDGYAIAPLAVHRELDTLASPGKDFVLQPDDVVVLLGPEEKVHAVARLFGAVQGQNSEKREHLSSS